VSEEARPEALRTTASPQRHGYPGRFWGRDWVYLDVDDRRYWRSRTVDGGGAIINRARLGEPEPAKESLLGLEHER
jgi:hypothetical protein